MRIGIDLGGTKTEIIVLAGDGRALLRERVATPRGDYAATVAMIAGLVRGAEQKVDADGTASIGVGIPGAESRAMGKNAGLIKNANSTWLIGRPLRADLEAALGRPVRLANDANCFALSEATDGAAAGAAAVFGVILGTGVGGGIVINGEVLAGANAIAGEWGHNRMPGESLGRPCYCGRTDCIETYLSGPALAAEGGADDPAALERYAQRLARALAQVINLLDPDVIVLGGGVSNLDRLYERVPRLWGEHVFSDVVVTRLAKNIHGDSSGVRGAAWLWPRPTSGAPT